MAQLIIAMAVTVLIVAFSMSNTHHVALSYVVGPPVQIRLIFLLAVTFLAGVMTSVFHQMFTRLGRKPHRRKQQLRVKRDALAHTESD